MRDFMTDQMPMLLSSGRIDEFVLHDLVDSDADDLIRSILVVKENRPATHELMFHDFFKKEYPEMASADQERYRSKVVRVLQDINAGEIFTSSATALASPGTVVYSSASYLPATTNIPSSRMLPIQEHQLSDEPPLLGSI